MALHMGNWGNDPTSRGKATDYHSPLRNTGPYFNPGWTNGETLGFNTEFGMFGTMSFPAPHSGWQKKTL